MISVSSVYAHASQRQGSVSDRPYSLPRIPGISRKSHSTPEPKVFDTWVQWLSSGLSSRSGARVSQSSAEPQQASGGVGVGVGSPRRRSRERAP